MPSILHNNIVKIVNDNEPHFVLKTRRYSNVKMASIPVPDMEITKSIDRGQPAKVWIEKFGKQLVMLVVLDVED